MKMGNVERREWEKAQRRQAILQAAKRIFLEKGFRETTMEEIAKECELAVGTLYFYFKNKDELYASLNVAPLEDMNEKLRLIMEDESLSSGERLCQAWDVFYQNFRQDPVGFRAVLHFQLEDALTVLSPEILEALNSHAKLFMSNLAKTLRLGMDKGEFAEENTAALADIFWSMFSGLILWEEAKRRLDPRKDFLEPTLELALKVFRQGIAQKESSHDTN